MVWHLQDLQEQIDAEKIEAPQLLPGIDIEEQVEEKRKSRRLYNPSGSGTRNELGDIDPLDKFQTHQKNAQQMLFREREVDNLMNMIYGDKADEQTGHESDDDEDVIDCNRYDVAPEKLTMYREKAVKRKLKSRFVTGQNSEQIVKNLLNMSDSEAEDNKEKKIDKE